ncbi:MAG TPA: zinc ribbon domain-containing protein [Gemmataceae bacterium]|nr:zinc ribbon domain-containing protein [Gemmataceae bacterium]
MPTYEYQCDACKHHFEELQSFSDPVLKKCPKCKKNKLQRLLGTGAAIIFKGSGFYQTDYRSESYKSAAKADEAKPAAAAAADKTDSDATSKSTDTKETSATKKSAEGKSSGKKAK